jgi:hypothetical protein
MRPSSTSLGSTDLRGKAARLRPHTFQERTGGRALQRHRADPASSGKTVRFRLHPGGDRQAINAIHTIAIIRAKHQPETRAYLEGRIRGWTKALLAFKIHFGDRLPD